MKKILFIILNLFLSVSCFSQTSDYREIFGDDWLKAEKFEKANREWLEPLLTRSHISYPVAIAIIFPELIRYSALRDKMETAVLRSLYVNRGEEYSNFSIGVFQMKPSFAEIIRSKFTGKNKGKNVFQKVYEYDDIKVFRKSIVQDLEDPKIQAVYLMAFIKICESKFKVSAMEEGYQVRFLATAYNYGFEKNRKDVDAMINRKFFSSTLIKSETYCYADISSFWYDEFLKGK